jgi:hypothetical protein
MEPIAKSRPSGPFVVAGIVFTVLLHGGVLAVVYLGRARAATEAPPGPGTFVDAQLVKFGKPRDLSFLPHKTGHVKTVGPPVGLKVARDENALPKAPKPEDKQAEKIDPLKRTAAELFKHNDDEQEAVQEDGVGSPTGSRAGTATEAKGDPYILAIMDQIGTAWTVPTTISPGVLHNLSADVCLTITESGALTHYEIKSSGNTQYDSSLEAALGTIKALPPPPPRFARVAARGRLCPTFVPP